MNRKKTKYKDNYDDDSDDIILFHAILYSITFKLKDITLNFLDFLV